MVKSLENLYNRQLYPIEPWCADLNGLKPSRDSRATSQRDSPIWIQPLGVFRYKILPRDRQDLINVVNAVAVDDPVGHRGRESIVTVLSKNILAFVSKCLIHLPSNKTTGDSWITTSRVFIDKMHLLWELSVIYIYMCICVLTSSIH